MPTTNTTTRDQRRTVDGLVSGGFFGAKMAGKGVTPTVLERRGDRRLDSLQYISRCSIKMFGHFTKAATAEKPVPAVAVFSALNDSHQTYETHSHQFTISHFTRPASVPSILRPGSQ
jgi:hypothetical protein